MEVPHEVILVDNASADDVPAVMDGAAAMTKVLKLERNRGFAAAVNAGVEHVRTPYVAILNDDTEPWPEWLAELVASIDRHPRAAAVASRVLRHDDPAVLDGAGDELTRSLKAYRRGQGERDGPAFDVERQVFSASGTACLWRADVFRELGGFDEDFFAYYEDVDLGLRARLAGWECWYAPKAVVLHHGGVTARANAQEFESYHAVRNRWLMTLKNVPRSWLLRDAHLIAFGEALSLSRSLLTGGGRRHLAAYRDVVRSLPGVLAERRRRRPDDAPGRDAARAAVERRLPPLRSTLSRR
jgi:GT2 family glycosyltransferase